MHAAQLRHRVVAVLDEDPLVELVGAVEADGRVDRGVTRQVEVADELVQEEAAKALGGPRVAREQCALDDFGEVDQGEDGASRFVK